MGLNQEVVKELLNINYFSSVGKPVSEICNFRCEFVSTIKQVQKSINGIKWEDIRIEKIGDVSSYLCVHHREE